MCEHEREGERGRKRKVEGERGEEGKRESLDRERDFLLTLAWLAIMSES